MTFSAILSNTGNLLHVAVDAAVPKLKENFLVFTSSTFDQNYSTKTATLQDRMIWGFQFEVFS